MDNKFKQTEQKNIFVIDRDYRTPVYLSDEK